MKTIVASLVWIAFGLSVYSQTNTFPASGSVGIGTTNPLAKLDVNGVLRLDNGTTQANYFATLAARYDSSHPFSLAVENNTSGNMYEVVGVYSPGGGGYFNLGLGLNGNVGIGTSTPIYKLYAKAGSDGIVSYFGGAEKSGIQGLYVIVGQNSAGGTDPTLVTLKSSGVSGGPIALGTGNTEAMRVTTGCNVGIGTASPNYRLEVAGAIGSSGNRTVIIDGGQGMTYTRGDSGGWAFGYHARGSSGTDRGGFGFVGGADSLLYYYIGSAYNNPTMVVSPSGGNVGIGTTNPSEKLSVNGRIRAKEVIVETTNWSDNVFDESYQLQSLSEVEQHIKTAKHLPGVPSAQEVAEKGVSVGDMQAILLAKIEELTLHQIEQEKEQSAQRATLQAQAAEIAALKSENALLRTKAK